MADGNLSLGLLKDVFDLFDKIQSSIMLTPIQKKEINDTVLKAVIKTESVFGKSNSREIIQNDEVAEAWSLAGRTIQNYLPGEQIGIWLQNKGEAWANPNKWNSKVLKENNLQIEQIKKRVNQITKTKRKFLRPKNI